MQLVLCTFTSKMHCIILFLLLHLLDFVQGMDEDTEVVLLPTVWSSGNSTVPLSFTAFGKNINLVLTKNKNLLSPNFEIWKRRKDDVSSRINELADDSLCHYIYQDSYSSAAVSLCNVGTVHGFVFLENDSLEITPLGNEESSFLDRHRIQVRSSSSYGEPHVIRKRRINFREVQAIEKRSVQVSPQQQEISSKSEEKNSQKNAESLTIELALFFDATAQRLFGPHFSNEEPRLLDMLLAYVNNIQALYYHPSLGVRIRLALVRLELMDQPPRELAGLDGEREQILDAFCAYSKSANPPEDGDPRHWDIGLYVSGLDFYALEAGKRNPVTMGLAPVGGVCWPEFACVIAEFGVTNRLGKPYPSAGFTSVYVAAHEIAHNLGMNHDSTGNDCPRDGYIMSPSRGVQGESQWSPCSRELASGLAAGKPCLLDPPSRQESRLDHSARHRELPGRRWTASRQCALLLREHEARVDPADEQPCQALRCRSPRRAGYYLAGPALDGTSCAEGKECRAGDCLPIEDGWEAAPDPASPASRPGGWSEWREGKCESGCIRGSLGYLERRRSCLAADPGSCPGLGYEVLLCKDRELCERRKRLEVQEHAGLRCLEFARHLPEIESGAPGLQAEHEPERPWVGCAVFCRRKDIGSYYAPKLELNDLGLDAYLPDGTWCHRDPDGENYFCRRHHCLPENFRFGKGLKSGTEEELLGPMNAAPRESSPELLGYFSLDPGGRPLRTRLEEKDLPDGRAWIDDKDYVELSELLTRRTRVQSRLL